MSDGGIDGLVAAAVAGDRTALNQLLVVIRPLVVRYCRSRLGTERAGVAADDVAQEVCVAVLKALPTYTDQGKPFLAFVYGIAAHKVVDAHRHAGRDRSDPTDEVPEGVDDRDGPEQRALGLAASAQMKELLAQLPDKQREILVLRVVVGLSAEETAEAVGSTPGAVRVAQHRAVSKLRGLLDAAGPDDDGEERQAAPRTAPARSGRHAARPAPVAQGGADRTDVDREIAAAEAHTAATLRGGTLRSVRRGDDRADALRDEHDRMVEVARRLRP